MSVGPSACRLMPVAALPGCGSRVATDPGGEGLGCVHACWTPASSLTRRLGMCQALATTGEAAGRGAGRALMAAAGAWGLDAGVLADAHQPAYGASRRSMWLS